MQLEITVNRRRFILVHAAPQELLETENERCDAPKEFMVWHRLSKFSRMPARKNVIFGHTPTWKYHKKPVYFTARKCLLSIAAVVFQIAAVNLDVSGWKI